MFPSHPPLLGNLSSTEPVGFECDGCSGLGAWRGGARGWVVCLGRPVGCSGALGGRVIAIAAPGPLGHLTSTCDTLSVVIE